MGEVPFFDRFRARAKPVQADTPVPRFSVAGAGISRDDKLAIIEELEQSGLGWFWATDDAGRVTYLSPNILAGFNKSLADLAGRTLQSLFTPLSRDTEARSLNLKLGSRKAFGNFTVQAIDAPSTIVLRLSGRPAFGPDGQFLGFRGSGIDITEEYCSEEEAARLARYDTLTGLSNRHRMSQVIDSTLQAFSAAERTCALFMLDLDRFKQVNDTLGHAAGDQLLVQVARRLESVIGSRGEIGRLGGDEFQVLIPDIDDRGRLGEMAKKIITMLSQPYSVEEGRCTIGASVGVAIAPYDGVVRDELTRAADLALYAAKNGGRGQFRFYAADLELDDQLRKRMEEDLSGAIEAGQLDVEYQPVVALQNNRVVALQARYTWEDPERGAVSPDTFLPIAEASRLIVPMGEWSLRKACGEAMQWPESIRLIVAVSAVQFADKSFLPSVSAVLEDSGLDPQRLEIEVSEAVFIGDQTETERTISALFKLGVRLSLDQFGTGYVSLSYLRRAPFSTVKIGQAFFESTINDELGDLEMVQAIVELAKVLRLETAAAGVESVELLDALRKRGVGHAQGFVFADTLTAEQVREEIDQGDWQLEPVRNGAQRSSRRTVFRRVGVIHEDHYYDVTLRNLSRTGAMIEGLEDVPAGTMFVLDFGSGQLAVASVARTDGDTQGLEFETALVDDGAGGLCTRHRVSPYELVAAGVPLSALPAGKYAGASATAERPTGFAQFKLSSNAPRQGDGPV